MFTVTLALITAAQAQSLWEVTPYRVRAVLAVQNTPQLPRELIPRMQLRLAQRAAVVFGAAWDTVVVAAVDSLHQELLKPTGQVAEDRLIEVNPDFDQLDKFFFVSVSASPTGFQVRASEFDCHTRIWSRHVIRDVRQYECIPDAAFSAVLAAFSPLGRIERPEDGQVEVRLRAGALIIEDDSAALVDTGAVMRPILRRNDRLGQPRQGGIQPIPWTYLTVADRMGSAVRCDIHSGLRNPLGGRGGRRTERFALAVNPSQRPTRLVIRARDDPNLLLAGYDVFAREPGSKQSEPVGRSDYRGAVLIPPSGGKLRILYIASGGRPLARLPIVPGLEAELSAHVTNDDLRLEAEGFVIGIRQRLVDLVARRQILASRVTSRIVDGKFEEAQTLLDQMRTLESATQFALALDQHQQQLGSASPAAQGQIDELFSGTKKLLGQYLDTRQMDDLEAELATARRAG